MSDLHNAALLAGLIDPAVNDYCETEGESNPSTWTVAAEVGAAYLDGKCRTSDAMVVAAYDALQRETDRFFVSVVDDDAPNSIQVVFTRCRRPYESDRELIAAVRASRLIEISSASIERRPIHPLLGCELGGPFDRFRAVHDLIGHVRTGYGFGLDDELGAWRAQEALHGNLARMALATEILAVNSALAVLGDTSEQKTLLLDAQLLQRARASVAMRL